MSPYVFVLCMERLSHAISHSLREGKWKPISLGRNGPLLSHLLFADDLVLFVEGLNEQVTVIEDSLLQFCDSLGQKISKHKSLVFSQNVGDEFRSQVEQGLGMTITQDLGRYLGVPILHKRVLIFSIK